MYNIRKQRSVCRRYTSGIFMSFRGELKWLVLFILISSHLLNSIKHFKVPFISMLYVCLLAEVHFSISTRATSRILCDSNKDSCPTVTTSFGSLYIISFI